MKFKNKNILFLTPQEQEAIAKLLNIKTDKEKRILRLVELESTNQIVNNPFSEVQCELNPFAFGFYKLIKTLERILWEKDTPENYIEETQVRFDIAKDIFIRNWPEIYMKLLD